MTTLYEKVTKILKNNKYFELPPRPSLPHSKYEPLDKYWAASLSTSWFDRLIKAPWLMFRHWLKEEEVTGYLEAGFHRLHQGLKAGVEIKPGRQAIYDVFESGRVAPLKEYLNQNTRHVYAAFSQASFLQREEINDEWLTLDEKLELSEEIVDETEGRSYENLKTFLHSLPYQDEIALYKRTREDACNLLKEQCGLVRPRKLDPAYMKDFNKRAQQLLTDLDTKPDDFYFMKLRDDYVLGFQKLRAVARIKEPTVSESDTKAVRFKESPTLTHLRDAKKLQQAFDHGPHESCGLTTRHRSVIKSNGQW